MWSDYIARMKAEFVGKKVEWCGKIYNIVDVDINGIIHIDRETKWNKTTAVYESYEARKHIVEA